MILLEAENDESSLVRFVSQNNRWELCLRPVLFGVRVQAGIIGDGLLAIDYCLGEYNLESYTLFSMIYGIFWVLPESVEMFQIQRMMPSYKIKPITKDKECCSKLLSLFQKIDRFDLLLALSEEANVQNNH